MKGTETMDRREFPDEGRWLPGPPLVAALAVPLALALAGGCGTPSAHTISRNYGLRADVPVDPPRVHTCAEDDCIAGGRLYKLYCGSCHNARPLGERPFNNSEVAIA